MPPFFLNLRIITKRSIANFPTYYVHLTDTPNVYLVNRTPNASVHSLATCTPMNAAIAYHRARTANPTGPIRADSRPDKLRGILVTVN